MQIKPFKTSIQLRNYINSHSIKREDIVNMFVLKDIIYLVYYGENFED